jgi:hypothetical protein
MEELHRDAEHVRDGIGRTVVAHLKEMAKMGVYFEENVRKRYPEFPARTGVHEWREYLPPLSPGLDALVARFG